MTDSQTTDQRIDPVDEFYASIWWRWGDVPGLGLRPATGTECADEIRRLRKIEAAARVQWEAFGAYSDLVELLK